LLVGAISMSVRMIGMASAVVLATRALDDGTHPATKLHESAIAMQKVWKQRHEGLRNTLKDRLDDHRLWAAKVSEACIAGEKDRAVKLRGLGGLVDSLEQLLRFLV